MLKNKEIAKQKIISEFEKKGEIEINIIFEAIEIASKPDIYSTENNEYPKTSGLYLCKKITNNKEKLVVPFFAYYRHDLNGFFLSDKRLEFDLLWMDESPI